MKKMMALAAILTLLTGAAAGCGNSAPSTPASGSTGGTSQAESQAESQAGQPEDTSGSTGGSQTVSTDGSTSMEKVIGFLSEAYMEQHEGAKVTYNPTGSGAGIQAVSEGRCDIGLSSRDLKEEEQANLVGTVIAIDGIGVVVNPENGVENLTLDQIAKIYTGEIDNWKDVGGSDMAIVCIGREAASGTRDGFEAVTGTADNCKYSQELTSTGDVIGTVSGNPGAIGYASVAAINDSVKAVSVEGVAADTETIQSGEYKLQRNFLVVTKKDAPLSGEAQAFFEFITSAEADSWITEAGATPIKR